MVIEHIIAASLVLMILVAYPIAIIRSRRRGYIMPNYITVGLFGVLLGLILDVFNDTLPYYAINTLKVIIVLVYAVVISLVYREIVGRDSGAGRTQQAGLASSDCSIPSQDTGCGDRLSDMRR
jgi:prepilin signal peptidase PulO-like enzyme (type II secretory pathway)